MHFSADERREFDAGDSAERAEYAGAISHVTVELYGDFRFFECAARFQTRPPFAL